MQRSYRAGVLVLPGGKPQSTTETRSWQLADQRMTLLTRALQRRLGSDVLVHQARYRVRGWNAGRFDALRDGEKALAAMRETLGPTPPVAVVGHSMGGRVAAHLSAAGDISAVAALAPWWPQRDGYLIPVGCRLLVIHGTADNWTDPESSRAQTQAAQERGVDAQWIPMPGAGHWLVRDYRRWHALTAHFIAAQLSERLPEP